MPHTPYNSTMENILKQMSAGKEVFWLNPNLDNKLSPDITPLDVDDAAARLSRFAPYIKKAFPKTVESDGIIESPLIEIPAMKKYLAEEFSKKYLTGEFNPSNLKKCADSAPYGRLLLKCDNLLPVSGSIKARGGIYEVLCLAEKLAFENGMLTENGDYSLLDGENFRKIFSKYSIAVGSTGNLGLSIGIMGARLGFKVRVHMSSDARQWKKDLLRKKGAEVIEYGGDYQQAVFEGRKQASQDPFCHFVDDENSKTLFLGYATAAERLRRQLESLKIIVDKNHPLFVYLPCGVGGGPGGVAYGLKQLYGADVHCFFAEPVEAPCMLLGVMTGKHDEICVQDIGLSGKTIADGLAVGRPSKFVGKIVGNLIDGFFTVSDERIRRLARELYNLENIFIEPSAAAGIPGYYLLTQIIAQNTENCGTLSVNEYSANFTPEALKNSTHIIWATGGGMVPKKERQPLLGL